MEQLENFFKAPPNYFDNSILTEDEYATSLKLIKLASSLLDDFDKCEKQIAELKESVKDADKEQLKKIGEQKYSYQAAANKAATQYFYLFKKARQRYEEESTPEKIFNDINNTLSTVTKEDYMLWLQDRRGTYNFWVKRLGGEKEAEAQVENFELLKAETKRGYRSFLIYLNGICNLQINALVLYKGISEEEAQKPLKEKAAQFYKPPKEKATTKKEHFKPELEDIEKNFYLMPSSPTVSIITDVLESGGDIDRLAQSKRRIDKRNEITVPVQDKKNIQKIVYKGRNSEITLSFPSLDILGKSDEKTVKIFHRTLIELQKSLDKGELVRECLEFPLSELAELGVSGGIEQARRDFKNAKEVIQHLTLEAVKQRAGKDNINSMDSYVLFPTIRIKNNQCIIFPNAQIKNWGATITPYYMYLPKWAFSLHEYAYYLMMYICFLKNQRAEEITNNGYFCIPYKTIQSELKLPDIKDTKRPGRDIRERIEKAIEEIEETYAKQDNIKSYNPDFALEQYQDDNAKTVKEWLDSGYLKVIIKGDFALSSYSKAEHTRKRIAANEEKAKLKKENSRLRKENKDLKEAKK